MSDQNNNSFASRFRALRMLRSLGQMPWAVADQMLISATNFISIILLARAASQSAFGEFTLVYLVLLFFNSVQAGIVTQPHNILGVTRRGDDYRVYTSSTALGQIFLSVLAVLLGLGAWGIAAVAGLGIAPLLLALVPATISWQILEFSRRILYTENRVILATLNDLISCGGQSIVVAWLWWHNALSGAAVFHAISLTSLAGGTLGLWQIRRSFSARISWAAFRDNWHFGKWVVGGEIVGHWLSAQSFVYLAAAILGAASAGVLKAIHTIFGPTRILADVMCTMLPIRFSRVLAERGRAEMHAQLMLTYILTAPILGAYCLGVAIFAKPILWFLYRDRYIQSAPVLCVYAIAAFTSYMTMIVAAALRARRSTRRLFDGQLYGSIIAIPIGWAAIHFAGVQGAALGMLASYGLTILFLWRTYQSAAAETGEANDPGTLGAQSAPMTTPIHTAGALGSGLLLQRVFALLDQAGIRYCVSHGYETYPERVASDVDLILPAEAAKRELPQLLAGNAQWLGARIVQWVRADTYYVVLMGIDDSDEIHHLSLDISIDYELRNHVLLEGEEILASRRRLGQFWVPSPEIEFACCLLRRVVKGQLSPLHAARLQELYQLDPAACRAQVGRFFTGPHQRLIEEALATGDWTRVRAALTSLRGVLLRRSVQRHPIRFLARWATAQIRRLQRWCRPRNGLHVVFLGPDGAGKSSVVRGMRDDLGPAFFHTSCRSFPPALLDRGEAGGDAGRPHELPQRSPLASVIRAVCYWLVYSSVGHFFTIRLERIRFSLSMHDRHFVDTLIDPRRYRYSGPRRLLEWIWRVIPKPDLVLVLDAPPDVIQSRKQDVSAQETARQCKAYRELAHALSMARLVSSNQSPQRTRLDVARIIIAHLAARTQRRLRLDREVSAFGDAAQAAADAVPTAPGALPMLVWNIGAGDQASIYGVACPHGKSSPAPELIVKLFNSNRPEVAVAMGEEFESLQHLGAALDARVMHGWTLHVPTPVAACDKPLAVIMSRVPGEPLHHWLGRPAEAVHQWEREIAGVLATALDRYWTLSGRIYGDFNLSNVLCDPDARLVSLVDPGMPEQSYLCSAVSRRWYPASRDVAYMLFDAATSIRANLWSRRLRRREWRVLSEMMNHILARFAAPEEAASFLAEVGACARVHLGRIRVPWSPVGLGHLLVRQVAWFRIARLLRRLSPTSPLPQLLELEKWPEQLSHGESNG
jgi:O-antigen/teichoic acid export membrane protein